MKKSRILALILVISISCFIHFWGLNHGTPNWQRSLQVFGTSEQIKKFTPEMLGLREKWYVKRYTFEDRKEKFTKEDFLEYFAPHKHKTFELLSRETVLDFGRGYILGLTNSDEQGPIRALANINPLKLDFDPDGFYAWGGLYFYSLGAFLLSGKILGILDIVRNISYYFTRPEANARIYILARLFSATFAVGCVILIYLIVKPLWGITVAFLSMFFLCLNPFFLAYSHQIKPHIYGMFWMLLGLYFCFKILKTPKIRYYLFSGISLGLSSGCVLTNAIFSPLILITELIRTGYKIKKCNWIYALLGFVLISLMFLIVTPYFLLNPKKYYLSAIVHPSIYGYGSLNLNESINFLRSIFTFGNTWVMLPAIALGIFFASRERKSHLFLIISLLSFIFAIFFMKHQGVFTAIAVPFLSVYIALGSYRLLSLKLRTRLFLIKLLNTVYVLLIVFIMTAGTIFYEGLFVQKGNLTDAGQWINQNVPEGTSVGIPGGWALPGYFPAISFLKYKLVNFPYEEKDIHWKKDKLPEYLIFTGQSPRFVHSPEFKNYYHQIKRWDAPKEFLGIRFKNEFIPTENIDVQIFRIREEVS